MIIVDKSSTDFSSASALKSALVYIDVIEAHMLTASNTAYVRQQTDGAGQTY